MVEEIVLISSDALFVFTKIIAPAKNITTNMITIPDGDEISMNITISPQVSSNVGLYNHNTQTYGWPKASLIF